MNEITKANIASAFRHLDPNQSLGEGIRSGFTWIGMKGKVWSLKHQGETKIFTRDDDGTPSPFLDVVIVGMNPAISKIFYLGQYNENAANPPDCASINGEVPDPGVPMPQSKTCANCKHNFFGTGPGGRGKKCQDHRRLAVLVMPYMTKNMLEKPLLEPVFFKVPPDSLKILKNYSDSLVHRGIHWATIITRITFAPDRQFQLNFMLKQALTDAEAPVILPLLDDPQTRNIVGGMPEIEEVVPEIPPAQEDEPIADTGLLTAFGKAPAVVTRNITGEVQIPAKRGPGRPRKSPPTLVATDDSVADHSSPGEEVVEEDDNIDDRVKKLLEKQQQKLGNMLK